MESLLRKHLATLNPDLARRADVLWELAKPFQARASKPDGSDNGTSHCLYVELYVWRLLSETQPLAEFTAPVLFLLSCSACCHDLDRGLKTCITEDAQHGQGSGEFVVRHHGELVIPWAEAIAVDHIVGVHDKRGAEYSDLLADLPEAHPLPTGPVDLQRLAVILRAADTLHTDNTRITELGTDPTKLEGVDRIKYLFRQCISGWRVEGNRIVILACPDSQEQWEALLKGEPFMRDEEWSPIAIPLRRYGFPHKLEFENDDHLWQRKAAQEVRPDLPGMDYYHEGDAVLLAGRDTEIKALEQHVLGKRSSLLIGPSGVGKSSVIHAGLVPIIRLLYGWGVVATRPDKVTGAFFTAGDFRQVVDGPIAATDGFAELCKRAMAKHSKLLVVLDQFEDIAYFGAFEIDPIVSPVLDALAQHRHLTLLFSYRDDVESLLLPLWQAISHTAAGLPKRAMRRLGRNDAEASLKKLLGAKKITLEEDEVFVKMLLDELAAATSREAGFGGHAIYPPFIQMVVLRLAELAEQGRVRMEEYGALAAGGHSATDQVITEFLTQSIKDLPKHGFAEEDGRRVLVTLAHSSGKKGSADESRVAAETHISPEKLTALLAHMVKMRLVRRLASGQWEIIHDLLAKSAVAELISEEERCFKEARELLDARARTFDRYHGVLAAHEIADLWTQREHLPSEHLDPLERAVLLLSMATMEAADVRNASYGYGHDIKDVRGELTDPATWSAPGWYWLSTLSREDLLGLARAAGMTRQMAGAMAYLKIASLIGSSADVAPLCDLFRGPFSELRKLAEDAIACVAGLATKENLPLLRGLAKNAHPYLRKVAAAGIGRVGTKDDLAILGQLASDEYPHPAVGGDFSVRDAVAGAVGNLGYREGLAILRAMVSDGDTDVLRAVARAIAKLGDEEGLPLLEDRVAKGHSWPAQHAAAKAYAELSTHGDVALLRESAKSGNAILQQGCAWVLRERGGPEDLPFLREMMKSSDWNVQHAAVAAVGKLGNVDDLPFLRKLATDSGHWPLRRVAVRAISVIGQHADFTFLLDVAAKKDDVSHLVGAAAGRVCWQLATREDFPRLEAVIRSPNTLEIWQGAINAMGRQFTDGEVLAEMSGVVLDSRPVVARMAAEIGVPRASEQQLRDFLARHQQKLSPQVLAVFDWCLYAPPYLRDTYKRWREKQNEMPPIGW